VTSSLVTAIVGAVAGAGGGGSVYVVVETRDGSTFKFEMIWKTQKGRMKAAHIAGQIKAVLKAIHEAPKEAALKAAMPKKVIDKNCSCCGSDIQPGALICGKCGTDVGYTMVAPVVADKPAEIPAPAMADNQMKTCPYCAEDVKAAAIKCKHCGSDI
jgi:hypothetical protein